MDHPACDASSDAYLIDDRFFEDRLVGTIGVFKPQPSATQRYIIINLRLVRIIASFCAGTILALGGVSYQAVLRNPMADPFILGVSSGSSFGVALAIYFGLASRFGLPLFALAGATGTTLFILALASRKRSSNTVLLLSGVAANYILSAAMTLLLFLNHEQYQRILPGRWALFHRLESCGHRCALLFFSFSSSTEPSKP